MTDHLLPIAEVPESVWLRALAHALDPEVEPADDDLAPDDDGEAEPAPAPTTDDDPDDGDDEDGTWDHDAAYASDPFDDPPASNGAGYDDGLNPTTGAGDA